MLVERVQRRDDSGVRNGGRKQARVAGDDGTKGGARVALIFCFLHSVSWVQNGQGDGGQAEPGSELSSAALSWPQRLRQGLCTAHSKLNLPLPARFLFRRADPASEGSQNQMRSPSAPDRVCVIHIHTCRGEYPGSPYPARAHITGSPPLRHATRPLGPSLLPS